MPTMDEKVRDVLGAQVLEIIRLQTRVETLEAELAAAKAALPPLPKTPDNETGSTH